MVAADGVNSRTRKRHAAVFEPDIDARECRFIWLGTTKPFPAFTFAFEETEHGWFQIHAYQFSTSLSTVIVETREETWRAHGLDAANHEQSIAFCEELFAKYLDGHRLMSNAAHLRGSAWLNFQRVLCKRWHHGNRVLIGDAAHTAHFSIGSGTKLAMEDAIALVSRTAGAADVPAALAAYQDERETEALKLQSAARNRMRWFEDVARYTRLEPWQFTYSLLTGSQRIGHANLKLRDPAFVADVEARLAVRAGADVAAPADVPAVRAARHAAREPRRRLADGAVLGVGRHAGRLAPRASRRPRDRRGGARVHRDDLRVAGRPHHAGLHRDSGTRRSATPGGASSISCTRTAVPGSACSSGIPGARVRRSSAGRTKTGRCRPATGRRSRRRRCRTWRASAQRRAR